MGCRLRLLLQRSNHLLWGDDLLFDQDLTDPLLLRERVGELIGGDRLLRDQDLSEAWRSFFGLGLMVLGSRFEVRGSRVSSVSPFPGSPAPSPPCALLAAGGSWLSAIGSPAVSSRPSALGGWVPFA